MKPIERFKAKFQGLPTDRCLFCPAIYEHKAALIGKSPAEVALDANLLVESVLAEYETYEPDMLTVGIDIYNVEAEAVGCKILFPDTKDAVPTIERRIFNDDGIDLGRLLAFDVEKTARLPLMLEACEKVNAKLGNTVPVRGAVSGPYSIAVGLMGIESAIMLVSSDPQCFDELMKYCTNVSINYAKAIVKRGLSVCVFDSYASPPLISPAIYENAVLPYIKRLSDALKAAGCGFSEYVIGGATNPIAEYMLKSGFDIILSDFSSDIEKFVNASGSARLIRRNISPFLIENGPQDELIAQVRQTKAVASMYDNVIIGTGVISYNCPPQNLLKVKKICIETEK
jgi:uroporphyrinogen decarboxylase